MSTMPDDAEPVADDAGAVSGNASAAGWRVIGSRGCGSAIVEAALVLAGIAYDREEVDYATPGPALDRLRAMNPLGQVPVVVLPNGSALTESAAIVQHLAELVPSAELAPVAGEPLRAEYLRWLAFFVAAIYPTFTYGDDPARWVGAAAKDELRRTTDAHRKHLWQQVERSTRAPFMLGNRGSMLDVYISVMTRWRPRREWFADECPRLHAIAVAVDADPRLAPLWEANFA